MMSPVSEFSKIIPSGQEHGSFFPWTRSMNRKYAPKNKPGSPSNLVGSTTTFQIYPGGNGFGIASGSMSQSVESISVKCKLPPFPGDANRTKEAAGLSAFYSDKLISDIASLDVIIDHSHRVFDRCFRREVKELVAGHFVPVAPASKKDHRKNGGLFVLAYQAVPVKQRNQSLPGSFQIKTHSQYMPKPQQSG